MSIFKTSDIFSFSLKDKKFYPTEIGVIVTDKLQEFFSDIINVEYTANMENDLDKIELADLFENREN